MSQGNPYGRAGGRWPADSELRAMHADGLKYDDIAEAVMLSEGWRPSRSGVYRRLRALGMPARNAKHTDLLPWRVVPGHSDSIERHWLQAESRRRKGIPQSDTDVKLCRGLNEALYGGRHELVIDYHPDTGFARVRRRPGDADIIRQPADKRRLRKELRAKHER